ncbi:MAG: hypothetical protein ACRDPA_15530, partial [Solirubrobacteraceae bacterium]
MVPSPSRDYNDRMALSVAVYSWVTDGGCGRCVIAGGEATRQSRAEDASTVCSGQVPPARPTPGSLRDPTLVRF